MCRLNPKMSYRPEARLFKCRIMNQQGSIVDGGLEDIA